MAKTQKQIGVKYAKNLKYLRFLHPFRKAKMLCGGIAFLCGAALLAFYLLFGTRYPKLENFYNTGGISSAHAQIATDCAQCHARPASGVAMTTDLQASLDHSCQTCHTQHTFHTANTVGTESCSTCHREHLGTGPMQPVKETNCVNCHGSSDAMMASAHKGAGLPSSAFPPPSFPGLVAFAEPRPAARWTEVISQFDGNHPDFPIQAQGLKDPNTLKFDHKYHLTGGNIPLIDGKKLDCNYCHKPDARGAYMRPVTFEVNCKACHSLQLDPAQPDFQIPHPQGPNSSVVRDFLLTLPQQFTRYAEEKNIPDKEGFVRQEMAGLKQRERNGSTLIHDVYTTDQTRNTGAPYAGCATCHEVKGTEAVDLTVTPPVIPDRWYVNATFNHAAHRTLLGKTGVREITCQHCHSMVFGSTQTADILLPNKESCMECHTAKSGVATTCVTCHDFHHAEPGVAGKPTGPATVLVSPLRSMLLGGR